MLSQVQFFVMMALSLAVFAVQVVAFVDALRRPARAFTAEGKLSKNVWLLILGIAAAIGLLGIPTGRGGGFGFLNIIAVTPAIIYWVDVRPRIRPYGGGGNRPQGPSGGW
ncbi:DUF2516 family protein [Isoptericola variabilis]|uniref:DUF2516 family protein n=1 Tax=Isoptericola variabilis (strain 225) TaxID=743718 RepID=F6FU13_ISOV2|nr:DUF2516 family protein [Isoptericola variabilis]AEG45384.1 Protein of unknown function DUF2516 [Isoptericola variabilis 225]TWH30272.1 uncharacterized protein DUF2516 [Isoptericola variabilis J7]